MMKCDDRTSMRRNLRAAAVGASAVVGISANVAVAASGSNTSFSAEKPSYSWRQTDVSLALLNGERVVWQLNFDKAEGKPYFHPLGLVDGTELTWLRPPDHPWHRGVWFSWKYINGLNYWEEDPETGLSEGRTELVEVEASRSEDYSARIEMDLTYHPPDETPKLFERRLITVSVPDKRGRYRIDWHSTFSAGDKDVLLDRTPIPGEKDSESWGGYAGLSLRLADVCSAWRAISSEGRRGTAGHGTKAHWLDFNGDTATGQAAGIAVFDHPANVRYPAPWYISQGEMTFFSPALLFDKPYTLPAGERLTLRYRILVHAGTENKSLFEKEWKSFAESNG